MNNQTAFDGSAVDDDEIDLGQLLAEAWAGKIWIFLATALSWAIAAIFLLLTPPTYQADSLLQIEEKGSKLALPAAMAGLTDDAPKSVAEIEIARSRSVLGQAVADMNLDWEAAPLLAPVIGNAMRRYDLPLPDLKLLRPYARTSEHIRLDLLDIPPNWLGQEILLVSTGDGGYSASLPDGRQVDGRVGELLHLQDAAFAIRIGALAGEAGREFVVRHLTEANAINRLRNNLMVSETDRQSGIIEFKFTDGDPERAQQILGAITRAYTNQNVARGAAEAESSLDFVESQLPQAELAVTQAAEALNEYRQSKQSVNLELEAASLLTQITRVEDEIETLNLREDEIALLYKPNHPVYQTLLNNRKSVEKRLSILRAELDALPEIQREIINLTRTLEIAQTSYIQLLNRRQELQMMRASNIGNVRIIDSARVAPRPIAPRKSRILAIALVLGGMLGVGFVLVRRKLRRGVESAEELEQAGFSVFATVNQYPRLKETRGTRGKLPIPVISYPNDLASEAIRSLRTSLHFGLLDAKTRSITITSSAPDAGKSFICVNLAAVAAQAGQKVCLIDADLRRGQLRRFFGAEKGRPGLSEVISGEAQLDDVLVEGPVPGLMLLPTGRFPPNPSELLMREGFPSLIKTLDSRFDLTICDTPPVLAVTDPVIVAKSTGATIAVVRFDKTPLAEIQALKRSLGNTGARLSGVILNGFDPRRVRGAYGYGYNYSYTLETKKR